MLQDDEYTQIAPLKKMVTSHFWPPTIRRTNEDINPNLVMDTVNRYNVYKIALD